VQAIDAYFPIFDGMGEGQRHCKKTMRMPSKIVPGTEGYAEDAGEVISRYESIFFVEKYKAVIHLLPVMPSKILDIGAGTGVDAAWLVAQGHRVLAVEPTDALREAGTKLHLSRQIEWLKDSLPTLPRTVARNETFDIVLVTAVWVHLDKQEHEQAMSNIAALLKPGALLIMSLRHGPAPMNRRVFEVTAGETIELAERCRLKKSLHLQTPSLQLVNQQVGVVWSWLVFQK
jgi:SAM-dependent methyltransferase